MGRLLIEDWSKDRLSDCLSVALSDRPLSAHGSLRGECNKLEAEGRCVEDVGPSAPLPGPVAGCLSDCLSVCSFENPQAHRGDLMG